MSLPTDSSLGDSLAHVPLEVRLKLAHAYFEYQAGLLAADVLHIKGYVFGTDTYPSQRTSSDVDLLVRPSHVDAFLAGLVKDGWEVLSTFESGSIFEHASTIYHPIWGLCDIHRYFPGIGYENPEVAFTQLWEARRYKEMAGIPCATPSLLDSRLLVVIHGARTINVLTHPDILHLKETLESETWDQMQERARELDALLAYDTALGDLEKHRKSPYYLMWKSVSEPVPAYVQWWARITRVRGLKNRVRVILQIASINEDSLAMSLGHRPSKQEKRAWFYSRLRKLVARR